MKNKSILLIVLLPLSLTSCIFGGVKTYTDKNDYYKCLESAINEADYHSELYIFPHEIKLESITNFVYKEKEDLFIGSYFFYLVASYNEEEFNNELNRLDNVKATFSKTNEVKPLLKYEENSLYVAICSDDRNEYVKYNKSTHEIAYVSNQMFEWDKLEYSNDHLIDDITIPSEHDDGNNTYNMYYSYQGDTGWYVKD